MKTIVKVVSTTLLLLTFLAPASDAQQTGDEATVRATMAGFMESLNALDAAGMAAHFAEDITAFVPSAQAVRADGKPAVTEIFRNFVQRARPSTPRLNLVPEDMTVEVSGNLGVVAFQVRDPAAGFVRRRTFIFRRMEGRWLISHFHASDLALPKREDAP